MNLNSGHVSRYCTTGKRQMLAFVSSFGGAGCSSPPIPPSTAKLMSSSRVKSKSKFPMSSWCNSRSARLLRPHNSSPSRMTRGALLICAPGRSVGCWPLAWLHVSHGGPAMAPTTILSCTAVSQKSRTSGLDTSPQMGSTTMSTLMVWMSVPSYCMRARSTKCWKSPGRRRPEKAWIRYLSLTIGRGTAHRGARGEGLSPLILHRSSMSCSPKVRAS